MGEREEERGKELERRREGGERREGEGEREREREREGGREGGGEIERGVGGTKIKTVYTALSKIPVLNVSDRKTLQPESMVRVC